MTNKKIMLNDRRPNPTNTRGKRKLCGKCFPKCKKCSAPKEIKLILIEKSQPQLDRTYSFVHKITKNCDFCINAKPKKGSHPSENCTGKHCVDFFETSDFLEDSIGEN